MKERNKICNVFPRPAHRFQLKNKRFVQMNLLKFIENDIYSKNFQNYILPFLSFTFQFLRIVPSTYLTILFLPFAPLNQPSLVHSTQPTKLCHRSYLINYSSKSYATPWHPGTKLRPKSHPLQTIPPIVAWLTIRRSVTWDAATWLLYSIRVKRNVDGWGGSRLGWDNKKWRSGRRTRHLIVRGTVVVVARTRSP